MKSLFKSVILSLMLFSCCFAAASTSSETTSSTTITSSPDEFVVALKIIEIRDLKIDDNVGLTLPKYNLKIGGFYLDNDKIKYLGKLAPTNKTKIMLHKAYTYRFTNNAIQCGDAFYTIGNIPRELMDKSTEELVRIEDKEEKRSGENTIEKIYKDGGVVITYNKERITVPPYRKWESEVEKRKAIYFEVKDKNDGSVGVKRDVEYEYTVTIENFGKFKPENIIKIGK